MALVIAGCICPLTKFSILETENKTKNKSIESRRNRNVSLLVVPQLVNRSPGCENGAYLISETKKAVDAGYSVKMRLRLVFEFQAFGWDELRVLRGKAVEPAWKNRDGIFVRADIRIHVRLELAPACQTGAR